MLGDIEALAAGTGALPLVFDPGEAVAVEIDGSLSERLSRKELCVEGSHGYEEKNRHAKPQGREGVSRKVDPHKRGQRRRKEEAKVAEADVNGFQVPDAKLTRLKPLPVVVGGRSGLRHRAIITR